MIRQQELIALTLCWTTVSCGFAGQTVAGSEETVIEGVTLRLTPIDDRCGLTAISQPAPPQKFELAMPWPCHFHKDNTGAVRIMATNKYRYLLVEASKPKSAGNSDCDTHLRAVRITGQTTEISQHQDHVASCPPFQWDNYLFTELFD